MKIVVENIFICLVLFWKCYFSYKFFTFSQLFSQHPNKFHYRKFQNHNHNHKFFKVSRLFSQRHYHTTTTTTKIKITERDRWVEDRWVEGEIAQKRDRAEARSKASLSGAVLDQCLVYGWIGVWFAHWIGVWFVDRRLVHGSFFLSLALSFGSLSSFFLWLSLSFAHGRKWFEGKMNL